MDARLARVVHEHARGRGRREIPPILRDVELRVRDAAMARLVREDHARLGDDDGFGRGARLDAREAVRQDVEFAGCRAGEVAQVARERLHDLRGRRHLARRVERDHLERVGELLELAPLGVLELELGARFGGDQLRALHLELLLDELGQRDGDDVALGRLLEFVARKRRRVVLGRHADVLLAQGLDRGVGEVVAGRLREEEVVDDRPEDAVVVLCFEAPHAGDVLERRPAQLGQVLLERHLPLVTRLRLAE